MSNEHSSVKWRRPSQESRESSVLSALAIGQPANCVTQLSRKRKSHGSKFSIMLMIGGIKDGAWPITGLSLCSLLLSWLT